MVYYPPMKQILTAIIPIALLILVGFIVQKISDKRHPILLKLEKIGIYTKENWSHKLNQYAIYLALPALIFISLTHAGTGITNAATTLQFTLLTSLIFLGATYLLAKTLYKDDDNKISTLLLCAFFGNIAYIGFPFITTLIAGSSPLISLVVGIQISLVFTVILYLLELHLHKKASVLFIFKKLFLHPLLLAVFAGVLLNQFDFTLHKTITDTITLLAQSASPVVLIALGAFFAHTTHKPKDINLVWIITGLKLIAFPLFCIVIAKIYFADQTTVVPILEAGMPVAITTFALADQYNLKKDVVAYAILASTLLSLITLPLLAYILV